MNSHPVYHISELLIYINRIVGRVDEWAPVVPLIVGLIRWRHLSRPVRVLVLNYAFWVAQAPLNMWSRRVLHTNMYLHHLDTFVETWFLGRMYYEALPSSRLRPWITRLLIVYSLIALADATVLDGIHDFNPYSRAAQTVLMLCLLLWYFEHWLRGLSQSRPRHDGMFLISVGLAIYFTGSITGYMFAAPQFGAYIQRVSGTLIGLMDLTGLVFTTQGIWADQRPRLPKPSRILARKRRRVYTSDYKT